MAQLQDYYGKNSYFSYDSLGQLVGSLNEDGEKTSYYYDNLGRIIKTIYSDGSISTKIILITILSVVMR